MAFYLEITLQILHFVQEMCSIQVAYKVSISCIMTGAVFTMISRFVNLCGTSILRSAETELLRDSGKVGPHRVSTASAPALIFK